MNYRNESQDVFFLTIFVDVEEPHLVCGVEVLVEVGVPGGRVHRVVLVVFGNVLGSGLRQKPEDRLPLRQDFQNGLRTGRSGHLIN